MKDERNIYIRSCKQGASKFVNQNLAVGFMKERQNGRLQEIYFARVEGKGRATVYTHNVENTFPIKVRRYANGSFTNVANLGFCDTYVAITKIGDAYHFRAISDEEAQARVDSRRKSKGNVDFAGGFIPNKEEREFLCDGYNKVTVTCNDYDGAYITIEKTPYVLSEDECGMQRISTGVRHRGKSLAYVTPDARIVLPKAFREMTQIVEGVDSVETKLDKENGKLIIYGKPAICPSCNAEISHKSQLFYAKSCPDCSATYKAAEMYSKMYKTTRILDKTIREIDEILAAL